MYTFSLARKRSIHSYIIEIRWDNAKNNRRKTRNDRDICERLHTLAINGLVLVIITRGIGNFGISLFFSHRLNQDY